MHSDLSQRRELRHPPRPLLWPWPTATAAAAAGNRGSVSATASTLAMDVVDWDLVEDGDDDQEGSWSTQAMAMPLDRDGHAKKDGFCNFQPSLLKITEMSSDIMTLAI
jgi:hypothetical protein